MNGQGRSFWDEVHANAMLVPPFFAICTVGAILQRAYLPALELAGLGAAIFAVAKFAKRQSYGWIVDAQGQRQKVDDINRGRAIYHPTTWKERIIVEASEKQARRKNIGWAFTWTVLLWAVAWSIYRENTIGDLIPLALGFAIVGCMSAVPLLYLLAKEIVYQSGFQDVQGAQVLDAQPIHPGLDDVAGQKAHGDARVATEDEAVVILNP